MAQQTVQDIATLAKNPLLAALALEEIGFLLGGLLTTSAARGSVVAERASYAPALCFVLEGELEAVAPEGQRVRLTAGDLFGDSTLAGRDLGYDAVIAVRDARLAWLSQAAFEELSRRQPRTAFHIAQGLLKGLATRLAAPARAAPLASEPRPVNAAEIVPAEVAGALVVAVREGERLLPLHASAASGPNVTPVTTRDWEGRDVYRTSAGLVLLEAARQIGALGVRLGPSISSGRLVFAGESVDAAALAQALGARLNALIQARIPIRDELWSVRDAIALFQRQNDASACLLLEDWLEPVVTLMRCGDTWATGARPLLPHAGFLEDVHVFQHPLGLLLDFGHRIRDELPRRPAKTMALELRAPRYGAPMTRSEAEWLALLGVSSVGTFNRACVQGKVTELIHVSEGFHEKRIADIADQVKSRSGVRVVAVAGPSSSGKTTFIKRLLVQLRVNGIDPLELSLDDYYLDRELQQRDAQGNIDFEVIDALDVALLQSNLAQLLQNQKVRAPRYDFRLGKSRREAGTELELGEHGVLLVEGIHALNPVLYGAIPGSSVFRVFIHPATSLPFDRLTSMEPSDVRLLRRLVRDRHQRGFPAEETLARWPSVARGERLHIYPFQGEADAVFDTSLIYEVSVLRVYAERYLLEVPRTSLQASGAHRLRRLLQLFVPIHPDHVPPTSILREFIGGSGFTY